MVDWWLLNWCSCLVTGWLVAGLVTCWIPECLAVRIARSKRWGLITCFTTYSSWAVTLHTLTTENHWKPENEPWKHPRTMQNSLAIGTTMNSVTGYWMLFMLSGIPKLEPSASNSANQTPKSLEDAVLKSVIRLLSTAPWSRDRLLTILVQGLHNWWPET